MNVRYASMIARLSVRALSACAVLTLAACSVPGPSPSSFARPSDAARAEIPVAVVALGERLFNDPRLSRDGTMSCISCHDESKGWSDGRAKAVGWSGKSLSVRTPTLLNLVEQTRMGWDGKFPDVASVTFGPISGPLNMGLSVDEALAVVAADASYGDAMAKAFGTPETSKPRLERAMGSYILTLVSGETPFDRWATGDAAAVGDSVKRGFGLFAGKANCAACHKGWTMSDGSFHDVGIGSEPGRGRLFPKSPRLQHAWKTPGLREVSRRAPYMHDGSIPTLEAVVEHYDKGGVARPSLDPEMRPLGLTPAEKSDLVSFLRSLEVSREGPPTN